MFYKLVMNGSAYGQDIRNILYYHTTAILSEIDFPFAGSEALAQNFVQDKWPAIRHLFSNDYTLDTVDVHPINDDFELVYSMPFILAVGETGEQTGVSGGPALCFNVRFGLEATTIVNGLFPPRRGYIAVGPIPRDWVGEDGYVTSVVMNATGVAAALDALQSDITQLLPILNVWEPVRMKANRALLGLVRWESYASVRSATLARRASFRRSRMPEL